MPLQFSKKLEHSKTTGHPFSQQKVCSSSSPLHWSHKFIIKADIVKPFHNTAVGCSYIHLLGWLFLNVPQRPNLNSRYRCPIHGQNNFTPIMSTFYKENTAHVSVPKEYLRSSHWLLQQRSVLYFQTIFCLLVMSLGTCYRLTQNRVKKNLFIFLL